MTSFKQCFMSYSSDELFLLCTFIYEKVHSASTVNNMLLLGLKNLKVQMTIRNSITMKT